VRRLAQDCYPVVVPCMLISHNGRVASIAVPSKFELKHAYPVGDSDGRGLVHHASIGMTSKSTPETSDLLKGIDEIELDYFSLGSLAAFSKSPHPNQSTSYLRL
jgi:hypothetical protein